MPHSQTETLRFRSRQGLLRRLTHALLDVAARRRDRRLLARLDPHLLRDIGLSPEDAQAEASKPFWRP
jgi:uncharacterized protein YjiS (DUF1127 family)